MTWTSALCIVQYTSAGRHTDGEIVSEGSPGGTCEPLCREQAFYGEIVRHNDDRAGTTAHHPSRRHDDESGPNVAVPQLATTLCSDPLSVGSVR